MKKTSQENKEKKKKKIILGWLFGILGAGLVATAIAVPLVILNKKVDHKSEHGFGLKNYEIPKDEPVFFIYCDSHDEHTLSNFQLIKDGKTIGEKEGQVTLEAGKDKYAEVTFTSIDVNKTTKGVNLVFNVSGFDKPETIKDITIIFKTPTIASWDSFSEPQPVDPEDLDGNWAIVSDMDKTVDVKPTVTCTTNNLISTYGPSTSKEVKLSIRLTNLEEEPVFDDFTMIACTIDGQRYTNFISLEGQPVLDIPFQTSYLLNKTIDFQIRLNRSIPDCIFIMYYNVGL
ncbi:MAG: hypothetical protein ACOQNV_01230 [Mycoplasmoidaceae bacterium]